MTDGDPYAVLGVVHGATHDDVRRAWLALARRHHPDRGGDAAAMQAVNDAWAVLGDPARRAVWDRQHGLAAPAPAPTAGHLHDEGGVEVDLDLLDPRPLLPARRSGIDLVPAVVFAASILTGCLAVVLDVPALLAAAGFLFFLSVLAVAAVALLTMRRSVRARRR